MDGLQQLALESLVVEPDGRLEWADEVPDHVLRSVVQQSCKPPAARQIGMHGGGDLLDQQSVLGDREGMLANGLTVPARDAGQAVRDVLDLDVLGRGIEQVEETAGKNALPGAPGG